MGTPSPQFFLIAAFSGCSFKKSRTAPLNIRLFSHELELENRIRNAYLFFDYWSIFQTNVKIILAILKPIDLQ